MPITLFSSCKYSKVLDSESENCLKRKELKKQIYCNENLVFLEKNHSEEGDYLYHCCSIAFLEEKLKKDLIQELQIWKKCIHLNGRNSNNASLAIYNINFDLKAKDTIRRVILIFDRFQNLQVLATYELDLFAKESKLFQLVHNPFFSRAFFSPHKNAGRACIAALATESYSNFNIMAKITGQASSSSYFSRLFLHSKSSTTDLKLSPPLLQFFLHKNASLVCQLTSAQKKSIEKRYESLLLDQDFSQEDSRDSESLAPLKPNVKKPSLSSRSWRFFCSKPTGHNLTKILPQDTLS